MSGYDRIEKALEIAFFNSSDGAHHKLWAIDQMVRALTGCPIIVTHAFDCNGSPYVYEKFGESEQYQKFVRDFNYGEEGVNTYSWDIGIAP